MAANMCNEQITAVRKASVMGEKLPTLIKRDFVHIEEDSGDESVIRLMQWNVLAQSLCPSEFVRCPPKALDKFRRRVMIIEELLRYQPTIICLQEVDQFSFIRDILRPAGFAGIFFPKPDSPCLYAEDSLGPDGCAIFYDKEKVQLLQSKNIVLRNGKYNTNQVSILAKFQIKSPDERQFYVAVTHLKARKGYETLRKSQCLNLTQYLWKHCKDEPLLVCGDFNAPPTEPAYGVMSSSGLDLESAYKSLSREGVEPKYTTWKFQLEGEVCEVLDYIWHSKGKVKVKALLNVASDDEIGPNRLPSMFYPSDHISLVGDFSIM